MPPITINLLDLEEGFSNSFYEMDYYLDTRTGQIIRVSDEDRANLAKIEEQLPETGEVDLEQVSTLLQAAGLPDWQIELGLEATQIEFGDFSHFEEVPRQDSRTGYRDMEKFIDSLEDEHLAELLDVAIQGRGAFRRFKDVLLNYPEARDHWFAFQDARLRERMLTWLDMLDLDYELVDPRGEAHARLDNEEG